MNYLQARILEAAGMPLTGYQKFLLELKEDIPVINAFGYYGRDGGRKQKGRLPRDGRIRRHQRQSELDGGDPLGD